MWQRLWIVGFLLVNWCWVSSSVHHCIHARHLGLFRYFTANLVGPAEIHWPQFHLTVIVSLVIVMGATYWPAMMQRLVRPIHPDDESAGG